MLSLDALRSIDEPIKLEKLVGRFFDGAALQFDRGTVQFEEGTQSRFLRPTKYVSAMPDDVFILPGGVGMHVHGRDVWEDEENPVRGTDKDQTYKEDAFTVSLALAQGGATFGMHQPNLGNKINTQETYDRQLAHINNATRWRPKPIMQFGQYCIILPDSKPFSDEVMYKFLWDTFSASDYESDEQAYETWKPYEGCWLMKHCEAIAKMKKGAASHYEQRPLEAAREAVKLALQGAKEFGYNVHIAHISSGNEIHQVSKWNEDNADSPFTATCEVTPQSLWLDYETFEEATGLDLKFGQQNPPIRDERMKVHMRSHLAAGRIHTFATDHAPHTVEEKEEGMSGMPQASTAGQLYLELVTEKVISLADFVRLRSTKPGMILEQHLGYKKGRIAEGYDGDFTIVSNNPSQITNEDVLTKCGWTPYGNMKFSHTIEAVVIGGTLYTQKALRKLSDDYKAAG